MLHGCGAKSAIEDAFPTTTSEPCNVQVPAHDTMMGMQTVRHVRYLSLFSGIEAASVAWQPLGWEAVAFSEIDKFGCELLAQRYPRVPNLGDVSAIDDVMLSQLGPIDVVVGGFPCQDLSISGKRKGLQNDDGTQTRSGLFYEASRVIRSAERLAGCRTLILENVPGLLSSGGGEDFAAVLGELTRLPVRVPDGGWQSAGVVANNRPDECLESA